MADKKIRTQINISNDDYNTGSMRIEIVMYDLPAKDYEYFKTNVEKISKKFAEVAKKVKDANKN